MLHMTAGRKKEQWARRWVNGYIKGGETYKKSVQRAVSQDWLDNWTREIGPTIRVDIRTRKEVALDTKPMPRVLALHCTLHKAESSVLVQARTGCIRL